MKSCLLPTLCLGLAASINCAAETKALIYTELDLEQAIAQDARQFQDQARTLGQSLNRHNSRKADRCRQLNQQLDELNGKPQLMYIAQKRYEAECLAGY